MTPNLLSSFIRKERDKYKMAKENEVIILEFWLLYYCTCMSSYIRGAGNKKSSKLAHDILENSF